jgi:outer membrane protein OmpA-like peptidoglycan-associated protein/tetratricopeptide (TPR) repeat protein
MRKTFLFLFLFVLISELKAQALKKADMHFSKSNYALAISEYQKYIEKNKPTSEIAFRLAESYRKLSETEKAAEWYKKALDLGCSEPVVHYNYGLMLKSNGDYLEAIDQFVEYGTGSPDNKERVKLLTQSCYDAMEWLTYPQQYEVINQENINSENSEFSPVSYNGQMLFVSDRILKDKAYRDPELAGYTGKPFLKVYTTDQKGNVKLFSENITGEFHDGPVSFSPTGDTLFITKTFKVKNPGKVAGGRVNTDEFVNRLELWYSVKKGNDWDVPEAFPFNNKLYYSVGHAAFTPDGKTVYFISDMPGGYGASDIWYTSPEKDGTWRTPVNLGPTVNSAGKEMFPYVAADNTLWFSSERPEGMGGLDLYTVQGKHQSWNNLQNLKFPLNSPKDDFGIFLDSTGTSGYFSSNRSGGFGSDDIFMFRKPGCVLAGKTIERLPEGKEVVLEDVSVELYRKGDTSEVVGYARSSSEDRKRVCIRSYSPCQVVFNAKGKFHFQLQQKITYELKASKEGYFTQTIDVPDDCRKPGDTINLLVQLSKIEINKPIVIQDLLFDEADKMYVKKNIYFDLDKANIRFDAALTLDKLVKLLEDNPQLIVELGAHTDSRHSDEYNMNLSQKRADAAVKYIVSKGVDHSRITAKGYGESMLLNECRDGVACSEEQHEVNRRVEIKVLEISPESSYIIRPNDTLYSIARKYNMDPEYLRTLNGIKQNRLYVGDIIRLR